MLTTTSGPDAGRRLRAVRESLRLSTYDVQRLSQAIARKRNDPDYYISRTWVSDIESGKFRPKLFKLHSLSLIYRRDLDELMSFFGLDIHQSREDQGLVNFPNTCLVKPPADSHQTITIPIELRDGVELSRTNLLSQLFHHYAEVPIVMLKQMDWQHSLYGYIGTNDYTLYPLIRPGALVQIDTHQARVTSDGWRSEFDRPVYFVDLRDFYVCSWCEIDRGQLILIPSPQSGKQARHVKYPEDADILGRVTAVTMPIADCLRI
jgi:transcriptional regulator with XRE-family HTH domain